MKKAKKSGKMLSVKALRERWPGLPDWKLAEGMDEAILQEEYGYDDDADENEAFFPVPFWVRQDFPGEKPTYTMCLPYKQPASGGRKAGEPYTTGNERGRTIYKFRNIAFREADVCRYEERHPEVKNPLAATAAMHDEAVTKEIARLTKELQDKTQQLEKLQQKHDEALQKLRDKRTQGATIASLKKDLESWKQAVPYFVSLAIACERDGPKKRFKNDMEHLYRKHLPSDHPLIPTQLEAFRVALPDEHVDKENRAEKKEQSFLYNGLTEENQDE